MAEQNQAAAHVAATENIAKRPATVVNAGRSIEKHDQPRGGRGLILTKKTRDICSSRNEAATTITPTFRCHEKEHQAERSDPAAARRMPGAAQSFGHVERRLSTAMILSVRSMPCRSSTT